MARRGALRGRRTDIIQELLPATVAVVEAFEDPAGATLFSEEEAVIRKAVDKRRREFTTARLCARRALAELGFGPVPILPGARGAPTWPAGVVGSITHCTGYRAAAVAHAHEVRAVGIDAEPHEQLPDGVLDLIARDDERGWLERLGAQQPEVCWDRLLFSAKESVYKVWFPLTGRWLDFTEASLTVIRSGVFTARLLVPGPVVDGRPLATLTGRWLARAGLVVTAITVPAAMASPTGTAVPSTVPIQDDDTPIALH